MVRIEMKDGTWFNHADVVLRKVMFDDMGLAKLIQVEGQLGVSVLDLPKGLVTVIRNMDPAKEDDDALADIQERDRARAEVDAATDAAARAPDEKASAPRSR
jgi:hypothetical protein